MPKPPANPINYHDYRVQRKMSAFLKLIMFKTTTKEQVNGVLSAICEIPLFSLSIKNRVGATPGDNFGACKEEQMHRVSFKPVRRTDRAAGNTFYILVKG